jgi:uncharacterized protein involved in exopolysaccharide biosynthesis
LETLAKKVDDLQARMSARMDRVEAQLGGIGAQVADLHERVARLEASREGDRSQLQADLARFMIEVERAELRLARRQPPADVPALPPESEGGAGT